MPAAVIAPALSDDELVELLQLMGGADSVELKLTVPEAQQRAAVQSLQLDPLDAQIRQVFFFDTPDLKLNKAGLVVRARRVQGKGDDSVVKLRPVVPEQISDELRQSEGFNVEVDAMPGGFVCSGTLKAVVPSSRGVKETVAGERPLRKMFTKEQRAFYEEHAPEGVALDDLSVLGPIFVLKLRFFPKDIGRKVVAEVWLYPDDSRILEISTKCAPRDAANAAIQARVFLSSHGIDLSGEQATKTKRALEFFSKKLKAEAKAAQTKTAEPTPAA
ncbi:MAG TPA: hypothetical protein VH817_11305 [Thermoleophilaceae bacterium]|jgi:hypothetical protein